MSNSEQIHFSVDEIAIIVQALTRHSLEKPECRHSLAEIMQETFEN